jgi:hypothetical protein
MKPRTSHLLFAAVALAILLGGLAALRFLPGAGKPRQRAEVRQKNRGANAN